MFGIRVSGKLIFKPKFIFSKSMFFCINDRRLKLHKDINSICFSVGKGPVTLHCSGLFYSATCILEQFF